MVFLIPHPLLKHTPFLSTMFYSSSHTKDSDYIIQELSVSYLLNIANTICLILHLNVADSLDSFLSCLVLHFFKPFYFRRHSLAFQFINFVDKPKLPYS